MADQLFNKKELIFSNRFRAATKGSTRPAICAMDWNWNCKPLFDNMVALASTKLIRVFGHNGNAWKMLMNRKKSGSRSIDALKWNPANNFCLAVAMGDGRNTTIDLFKFKDPHFRRFKQFLVPDAGSVSSLSWNHNGSYMVAAIKRDAYHPEAEMFVLQKLKGKKYNEWRIKCDYQSTFTAKFHSNHTIILSVSVKSTEISVWTENADQKWEVISQISCDVGITDICMDFNGMHIAAIVGKQLRIWKYSDDHSEGISTPQIGLLLTGSSKGTFCVHGQPPEDDEGFPAFEVVYFRYSYVHAYNKDGPVTCVAWIPFEPWKLAVAGNDGVVIVWELADSKYGNKHERNYMKEINYFYPGRQTAVSKVILQDFDVDSIGSMSVSASDAGSDDDDSSDGEEGDEAEKKEVLSAPASSRVRKVLRNQEDLKGSVSEVFKEVEDASRKLDKLQLLAEERNKKICDLVDNVDKIKAKQDDDDLEENLESLLQALHKIKDKLHEIVGGIKNSTSEIVQRMNLLEEELKQKRTEGVASTGNAGVSEEERSSSIKEKVLTKVQEVLVMMNENQIQVSNAIQEVLMKVKSVEEKANGEKEARDELLSLVTQVISKQNVLESSILSVQQNDTKFSLKLNQLELSLTHQIIRCSRSY